MSLLVVGSIAFDTIKTPGGEAKDVLGGSAVHFALAASLFCPVRLVGVVGDDFDLAHLEELTTRPLDLSGIEVVPGGKTFRWSGEYSADMNQRETLSVELNVFENFEPKIPAACRDSSFVFLANGSPRTQLSVLDQMQRPEFVMADTMDLWIQTARDELLHLLKRVDCVALNDSEALLLSDRSNVIEAGRDVLDRGPSRVLVKKGEHGAVLFSPDHIVPLPAYPTTVVRDPTGAGDSFAGALMGHLARSGNADERTFRQAIAYGCVVASFSVEDFGTRRLPEITLDDVEKRFDQFRGFLQI